jgi:uncharacterized membrane protein YvlD (DUF360 family)
MLLRFVAVWAVDALSLLATAALLPSISLAAQDGASLTIETLGLVSE